MEDYLENVASLPKLAFDTNLGSFAMQQGELQVLPGTFKGRPLSHKFSSGWAVDCPELQELFGQERLQGVLASRAPRHRIR